MKTLFKKMKFKVGNLITHVPTKSVWIIIDEVTITGRYSAEVNAFCLYGGKTSVNANTHWRAGILDTWLLTKEDLDPSDKIWQIGRVV
tara:strand:- start:182 stop:445 length:264 start_codon:yes stop_codon:yes gene_type:complete